LIKNAKDCTAPICLHLSMQQLCTFLFIYVVVATGVASTAACATLCKCCCHR